MEFTKDKTQLTVAVWDIEYNYWNIICGISFRISEHLTFANCRMNKESLNQAEMYLILRA